MRCREMAAVDTVDGSHPIELEMDVLGTPHRATVVPESPLDPANERLRA